MPRNWPPLFWTGLWILVMATALATRPLLPVDETRYLAVAWDMWLEGNWLVPHLNGEPYSHKPPLLFWLINLGWSVFGVNDWWPRLVAPMCGLASLFLTHRLARESWPGTIGDSLAPAAPLVLFGGLFWALFTTLTMFDMMLTLFTLVALLGVARAWRRGGQGDGQGDGQGGGQGGSWSGFALMGLGIGFGVLTKGPAILLHTLPVALLAPWWGPFLATAGGRQTPGWGRWYAGVFGAVILGAAIGLAWAVPAGLAGGEAYREAIFWGQSAGRIVSSFAHRQPWWWYGAVLPVLLLPWVLWPPAWRASWRAVLGARQGPVDGGVRFCISWFVPAVLVFSFISGKQPHYLLPELPAAALVLARLLFADASSADASSKGRPVLDQALPALLAVGAGAALFTLASWPFPGTPPTWLDLVETGWGLALAAAGLGFLFCGRFSLSGRIQAMAGLSAVFVVAAHLGLRPVLAAVYDLRPVASRLAGWERQGVPLANFGKYHGQYHFLGRLTKPIAEIGLVARDTRTFLKDHPKGLIVAYHETLPRAAKPVAVYRFRNRWIAIWDAETVIRIPNIAER